MATTTNCGRIILAMVIAAAIYAAWTLAGSTSCLNTGIERQTRTTFAPFEGCTIVDDFRTPDWMFEKRVENR